MTIKEFYDAIDGNYADAFDRFQSDDFLLRFVKMFEADQSYVNLGKYLEAKDAAEAFRASHTLKGTALNLGFSNLATLASTLTEVLRTGSLPDNSDMYDAITVEYEKIMSNLKQIGG